jgi:indole-3-glycerol phosphate synthase
LYPENVPQLKEIFRLAEQQNRRAFFAEVHYHASYDESTVEGDLSRLIALYERYCDAVVVAVDGLLFKGTYKHLANVRLLTKKHVATLDLVVNNGQLDAMRLAGANSVILMPALVNKEEFLELFSHAKDLNLGVIIELQSEEDLEKIDGIVPNAIGINCRDKDDLRKVDLSKPNRLATLIRDTGLPIIAESGIKSAEDVKIFNSRIKGVLIGSSLLSAMDTEKKLLEFSALPAVSEQL